MLNDRGRELVQRAVQTFPGTEGAGHARAHMIHCLRGHSGSLRVGGRAGIYPLLVTSDYGFRVQDDTGDIFTGVTLTELFGSLGKRMGSKPDERVQFGNLGSGINMAILTDMCVAQVWRGRSRVVPQPIAPAAAAAQVGSALACQHYRHWHTSDTTDTFTGSLHTPVSQPLSSCLTLAGLLHLHRWCLCQTSQKRRCRGQQSLHQLLQLHQDCSLLQR
jgi:hypothetical protein